MIVDDALFVARAVRRALIEEFPSDPACKQCKRAAILFDIAMREMGYSEEDTFPTAGFVDAIDSDRGHVWNIVYVDDAPYILDVTLRQFYPDAPAIVWGPAFDVTKKYRYIDDGLGAYEYEEGDVRPLLVRKVLTRVRSRF